MRHYGRETHSPRRRTLPASTVIEMLATVSTPLGIRRVSMSLGPPHIIPLPLIPLTLYSLAPQLLPGLQFLLSLTSLRFPVASPLSLGVPYCLPLSPFSFSQPPPCPYPLPCPPLLSSLIHIIVSFTYNISVLISSKLVSYVFVFWPTSWLH